MPSGLESVWTRLLQEVDNRIAKALARVGVVGSTIDLSRGGGVLPGPSLPWGAAGYPVDVAATEADGTATTAARSDHQHAHGGAYLPDAHHDKAHDHNGSDGSGTLSNDLHDGYSDYIEIAAPAAPTANRLRLYGKDNSGVTALYYKGEDNVEVGPLAAAGALADHDHSGDAGDGGTFDAANLTSGAATDGWVLTADGIGGAAWEAATGGTDPDAIHDNVDGEIAAIAEKASPIAADLFVIEDSAAANAKKRAQVGNLPAMTGDSGAGGAKGYVPAPAAGDAAAGKYLKASGAWAVPPTTDATAIHDNVDGEIAAIAEKASPVSADLIVIEDSAASNAKKRVQIGNLPASIGLVASDAIWDAKGDLAVGTGANTASKLSVGADKYVLAADSAEATGQIWADLTKQVHVIASLGITKDGGDLVSDWADRSLYSRNLVQATATNQPLWVDNVINSEPVVRFDGADNFMSTPMVANTFNRLTIAIVFRPRDATATEGIMSWSSSVLSGTPFILFQRNSGNVRWLTGTSYKWSVALATDATSLHIVTWNGSRWECYIDGTQQAGVDEGAGANQGTAVAIYAGCGYNGYSYVEIPEFILWNKVLSASELSAITTELKSRYGIA